MNNDFIIELIATVGGVTKDEKIGELIFDLYDKNHSYHLGNVIVDAKGRLGWSIWNDKYENEILYFASVINGKKVQNTIVSQLEALKEDSLKWSRAKEFISKNNLDIQYNEDRIFEESIKIH